MSEKLFVNYNDFCKELEKGELLVGNNAEFAKEIAGRHIDRTVGEKSEVAAEIFLCIYKIFSLYDQAIAQAHPESEMEAKLLLGERQVLQLVRQEIDTAVATYNIPSELFN